MPPQDPLPNNILYLLPQSGKLPHSIPQKDLKTESSEPTIVSVLSIRTQTRQGAESLQELGKV